MAPAAEEIARFLELLESGATDEAAKEKAAALMQSIPDLLPEDPEGAALIADAMAEAYAQAAIVGSEADLPFLANEFKEEDHPRDAEGKFTESGAAEKKPLPPPKNLLRAGDRALVLRDLRRDPFWSVDCRSKQTESGAFTSANHGQKMGKLQPYCLCDLLGYL